MRRLLPVLAAILMVLPLTAQTAKEDFSRDVRMSGSNFLAYPGPAHPRLTPAPKGKRPFYISHYGRHGSRFHTKSIDYDYAVHALQRASSHDALTPLGSEVLQRLLTIRDEAKNRLGDLTPLGQQQHREIARRMYKRFPEVFKGRAVIEAHSTTTPRCILSMASALEELVSINPRLKITQDATEHDHYYMKHAYRRVDIHDAKDSFKAFCDNHPSHERVVASLFSDTAYMNNYINAERLNFYLFRVASNLQSSEVGKSVTLYDLFNEEEVYQNWLKENASWFLGFGFSDLCGGDMPFSQANLLRKIIEQADSCIRLPKPGCTLRFGHETMRLPLTCLLGINGYGQTVNDLEQLEQTGWRSYRIFPMGANIQFIFYRSKPGDDDVVFKVLLNEDEATLPLPTDMAPYYHWRDFREHYLKMLDDYAATHSPQ